MKPDVCRRVVGRLPSPRIQDNRLGLDLVSTARDGATVQPPPLPRGKREVHGGLSCEIVSDLCPNPLSHDWHVQPSCQRPNRPPPERREFSPDRILLCGTGSLTRSVEQSSTPPTRTESDCPRNPTNILCRAKPCQRPHPTEFPPLFHIGKGDRECVAGELQQASVEERPFQGRVSHPIDEVL